MKFDSLSNEEEFSDELENENCFENPKIDLMCKRNLISALRSVQNLAAKKIFLRKLAHFEDLIGFEEVHIPSLISDEKSTSLILTTIAFRLLPILMLSYDKK